MSQNQAYINHYKNASLNTTSNLQLLVKAFDTIGKKIIQGVKDYENQKYSAYQKNLDHVTDIQNALFSSLADLVEKEDQFALIFWRFLQQSIARISRDDRNRNYAGLRQVGEAYIGMAKSIDLRSKEGHKSKQSQVTKEISGAIPQQTMPLEEKTAKPDVVQKATRAAAYALSAQEALNISA